MEWECAYCNPRSPSVMSNLLDSVPGLTSLSMDTPLGSGWLATSFILANIILGVGLLNVPAAYSDAGGIPCALGAQTFCLIFIILSLYLISECADVTNADTYQQIVRCLCGFPAYVICNILIFLHNFGTCVTFMVILGDQMDQVMLYTYGEDYCQYWYMSRTFTLTITALLMLPLSFYARIDSFKFISVVGVVSTLYITFLVVWKFITYDRSGVQVEWVPTDWVDIFRVIPVICFSFEGHIEAVPLYACLRRRKQSEFLKVCVCALAMCGAIYTLVGCLVYLTVGDDVPSDLLSAYYPPDIPILVGTAIVRVKAIVTYPGVMFCSRMVLDDCVHRLYSWCGLHSSRARIIESVILFALALVLAHLVPTIGSLIAVLGGSAAIFVFVFPGLCVIHIHKYGEWNSSKIKVVTGVVMVALGVFLAATTTVQACTTLAKHVPHRTAHECQV